MIGITGENDHRLKEIIGIAYVLGWVTPKRNDKAYPEMQLSEVEKCMVAMVDDNEFERLRKWNEDAQKQKT